MYNHKFRHLFIVTLVKLIKLKSNLNVESYFIEFLCVQLNFQL